MDGVNGWRSLRGYDYFWEVFRWMLVILGGL